jgi:hypothetical protein
MVGRAFPLLMLALTACAGAQHPWSSQNLCELEKDWKAEVKEHETWMALLLRGYDPQTRRVTDPPVDCTGAQVRWEGPAAACFDNTLYKTRLPGRPLGEKDVVVSPIGEDLQLVWIVTDRFASGDAMGPVAVVETGSRRLVVRALGVLRGYTERAKLRLEKVGDTEMLVAEGERCTSADPASCQRAARVMPFKGQRFVAEPVFSEAGACVSPAWFDLSREERESLESGWKRRYQLTATLLFEPAGIKVDEQLVVHDLDPRQPQAPPRIYRRAQEERTVRLVDGKLVVTGRSLWNKVMAADKGS